MSNELDMEAYHANDQAIEPGQHKVFTIENQIHSFGARFQGATDMGKPSSDTFNQRFEGEPGTLPTQGPSFDSTQMPPWWVRVLGPETRWPGEGLQWLGTEKFNPDEGSSQKMPYFNDSPAQFTPISMKGKPGDPNDPFRAMAGDVGRGSGIGGASGKPTVAPDYSKKEYGYWNEEGRAEIQKRLDEGKTYQEIVDELGSSATKAMTKFGMKSQNAKGPRPKDPSELDLIRYWRAQGDSWDKIATTLNRKSGASVRNLAKRYGLNKEDNPDWFNEEMNDPETQALRDWYKNQFEGAPVEATPRYTLEKAKSNEGFRGANSDVPRGWASVEGGTESGPGEDKFIIKNSEGKEISSVHATYMPDQKRLSLSLSGSVKNANSVGTLDMKTLTKELLKHYPEAEWLSGYRTTGARTGNSRLTLIPISKFMRE